jgi:uncharacterized repeat protein (TIGR01451 family)
MIKTLTDNLQTLSARLSRRAWAAFGLAILLIVGLWSLAGQPAHPTGSGPVAYAQDQTEQDPAQNGLQADTETPTPTETPSATPTNTLTATPTATPTATVTLTPTLTATLTDPPPTPISITRSEPGQIIGGIEGQITVMGAGFTPNTKVRLVGYGLLNTTFVNAGALTGVLPATLPPGAYKVQATDPDGGTATSPNTLTVLAPTPTPLPTLEPSTMPTLFPTREPATPVPGQPSLVVRDFIASPAAVAPGQSVQLTFIVVNQGNRAAQGVSVAVDPGGKFVPANGQASVTLPDLGVGGSIGVQLMVDVMKDAPAGPNTVPITMSYRDFSGEVYTSKANLSVVISETAEVPQVVLSSYSIAPSPVKPGQTVTISGQVRNSGSAVASQVLLRVAGTENVLLAGPQGDTLPLGDIQPGASITLSLQMVVKNDAKPGPQPQPISLSYILESAAKDIPGSLTVEVANTAAESPLLLLESFSIGKDFLRPGEIFDLSLTLQNVGKGTARELLVTFGTVESSSSGSETPSPGSGTSTTQPSTVFATMGGGGTIYVGLLGANGQETEMEQKFIVSGTVESGIYALPITLRYQKEDGTSVQSTVSASLVVIALPRVQVTLNTLVPESVMVGDVIPLEFEITNHGSKTFNLIKSSVETTNAEVMDGKETVLAPVKTDSDTSFAAQVMAQAEGTITITVKVHYLNDLNQEDALVFEYQTEAMPMPEPPPDFGEPPIDVTPPPEEPEKEDDTIGRLLLGLLGLGS